MTKTEAPEITRDSPEFQQDVANITAVMERCFEDSPDNKIHPDDLISTHKAIMTALGINKEVMKNFSNTESHARADIYLLLSKITKGAYRPLVEEIVELKYSKFREKNRNDIGFATSTIKDREINESPRDHLIKMQFGSYNNVES